MDCDREPNPVGSKFTKFFVFMLACFILYLVVTLSAPSVPSTASRGGTTTTCTQAAIFWGCVPSGQPPVAEEQPTQFPAGKLAGN